MKHTRKLVTLIIVLAMVMAMATTAFAATNDSITITNPIAGATYNLYKLFDLAVDNEVTPTKYTYTVNSDWTNFFTGDGAGYVTINDAGAVTAISDAAALAKAAAEWADKPSATATKTFSEGERVVLFSDLSNGYWLVTSTVGTVVMTETTPDKSQVEITEKNTAPSLIKHVGGEGEGLRGSCNAHIGDTVYFEVIITAGQGVENYVLHDTMDAGFTAYTNLNVALSTNGGTNYTDLTEGTDYTVNTTTCGCSLEIAISKELSAGNKILITYESTLDTDAVLGSAGNINTAYVAYGTNMKTPEQNVAVYTYSINLVKTDAVNNVITGAQFKLYEAIPDDNDGFTIGNQIYVVKNDDGTYTTTTTANDVVIEAGNVTIKGLEGGKYYLEEVKQPDGYNILTEPVLVSINGDNLVADVTDAGVYVEGGVQVINQSGTELPSTGGIGTTIFYVLGGILAVGALIVLVTNKRMRAN